MNSANQYTLHLLPEPYLREIRTEPKELDFSSHMLYSLAHREWEMLSDKTYPIIGTFTGKEGDIWEEGKDFEFKYQLKISDWFNIVDKKFFEETVDSTEKRIVAIPITQPEEETQEDIWDEIWNTCSKSLFDAGIKLSSRESLILDNFLDEVKKLPFSITRK